LRLAAKVLIALVVVIVLGAVAANGYTEYAAGVATSQNSKVTGFSLENVTFTGAVLVAALNLTNPSGYSTPPFSISFSAYIGNFYLSKGTIPQLVVPGKGYVIAHAYLPFNFSSISNSELAGFESGNITISLQGSVHTHVLFGTIPLSFPFKRNESG
jgi:LEA14-like dessication related protein